MKATVVKPHTLNLPCKIQSLFFCSPSPPSSSPDSSTISLRDLLPLPASSPFLLSSVSVFRLVGKDGRLAGGVETRKRVQKKRDERGEQESGAEKRFRRKRRRRRRREGGKKRPRGSLLGGGRKVCLKY